MKENKTIYIIDDDPITVFGIKKMLSKIGIVRDILVFKNGSTALSAILTESEQKKALPEIIFLDINMPIMDGWDFLEEFIKIPIKKPINIKIITSSIDPFDRKKWKNFKESTIHSLDFINKPVLDIKAEDLYKSPMST